MRISIIAMLLIACGVTDEPSAEICARVRDHVADLRVEGFGSARDAAGRAIDMSPHRDAMKHALGDKFVTQCVATMTPTQIRCALDATSSATVTSCLPH